MLLCETCHILHITDPANNFNQDQEQSNKDEEDKKEETSDSDGSDDIDGGNKPWFKMYRPKAISENPPPALNLLVAYFKSNP